MGSTLARHIQERLTTLNPKTPNWFLRKFTWFFKKIFSKEYNLGSFQALGFPVNKLEKLSDNSNFFELFIFDLLINEEQIDSPVGIRVMCLLPTKASAPIDELSENEELDLAGDVVWSDFFGNYILKINGIQIITRSK